MLACLVQLVRDHRRRRAVVRRKADRIVAIHGRQGWSVARGRACLLMHLPWHERLGWSVAAHVRRQLGLRWGSDPASHPIIRPRPPAIPVALIPCEGRTC